MEVDNGPLQDNADVIPDAVDDEPSDEPVVIEDDSDDDVLLINRRELRSKRVSKPRIPFGVVEDDHVHEVKRPDEKNLDDLTMEAGEDGGKSGDVTPQKTSEELNVLPATSLNATWAPGTARKRGRSTRASSVPQSEDKENAPNPEKKAPVRASRRSKRSLVLETPSAKEDKTRDAEVPNDHDAVNEEEEENVEEEKTPEKEAVGKKPTKGTADTQADHVAAPRTPPSTCEGLEDGEDEDAPLSSAARRLPVKGRPRPPKPGTGSSSEPAGACASSTHLGCFNFCMWFERDRERVMGQVKRHARIKSATVREVKERLQDLQKPAKGGKGGKGVPVGPNPWQQHSVLQGKSDEDKVLAVEFGPEGQANSRMLAVGELWGFRSYKGTCEGADGKPLATSTLCCKVQGHPDLIVFFGFRRTAKPLESGDLTEEEKQDEEAATAEVRRFAQFVTDIKAGNGPGVPEMCRECVDGVEREQLRKRKLEQAQKAEAKKQKLMEEQLVKEKGEGKAEREKLQKEMKDLQKQAKKAAEETAKSRKEAERLAKLLEKRKQEKGDVDARLADARREAASAKAEKDKWFKHHESAEERIKKLETVVEEARKQQREARKKVQDEFEAKQAAMERKLRGEMEEEVRVKMEKRRQEWERERIALLQQLETDAADAARKEAELQKEKGELERRLRDAEGKTEKGSSAGCKDCPMCKIKEKSTPPPTAKAEEIRSRSADLKAAEADVAAELERLRQEVKRVEAEHAKKLKEERARKKREADRQRKEEARREDARLKAEAERLFNERIRREEEERRRREHEEQQRRAEDIRRKAEEERRKREAQELQNKTQANLQYSEYVLEMQFAAYYVQNTDRWTNYDKYESMMNQVKNSSASATQLSFFDIPWPPPNNPLFLMPFDDAPTRKKKLVKALLFWHTDKFNAVCGARILAEHREAVEGKVRRVAQEVIEAKAKL